jgi:hypothetical protein
LKLGREVARYSHYGPEKIQNYSTASAKKHTQYAPFYVFAFEQQGNGNIWFTDEKRNNDDSLKPK